MVNKEELIWKKIDSTLSDEETKLFNKLISQDDEFVMLYKSQLKLHNLYRNIPLHKAPVSLVNSVMSKIDFKKSWDLSYPGVKLILWVFAGLTALVSIVTLSLNVSIKTPKGYNQSVNFINNLIPGDLMSEISFISSPIMLALLGLTLLVWLDKFWGERRQSLR